MAELSPYVTFFNFKHKANKMKTFTKTLLAGALALAATGAAQASGTNGDVFLSVADQTNNTSYALDLGLNQTTLIANMASASYSLVANTDSAFTAFYNAAVAAHDTLVYSVGSQDGISGTNPNYGVLTTLDSNGPLGGGTTALTPTNISAAVSSFVTYTNGLTVGGSTVSPAGADFTTLLSNNLNGKIPNGNTEASLGNSLDLWGLFSPGVGLTHSAASMYNTHFLDTANFAVAGGVGTLTIAQVSQVPLPAAVWMFGAGLMGMLRLNRRKAVAA
jgi:hypothetical protein